MILKKFNPGIEHMFFAAGANRENIRHLDKIPKPLLNEVEKFTERNSLAIVISSLGRKKPIYQCCDKCLKAHLIKKARGMGLGKRVLGILSKLLKCKRGHEGYYLDDGRLVKI